MAFQVLHSREGSWPHPQTLDEAVKSCQGKTWVNLLVLYHNRS